MPYTISLQDSLRKDFRIALDTPADATDDRKSWAVRTLAGAGNMNIPADWIERPGESLQKLQQAYRANSVAPLQTEDYRPMEEALANKDWDWLAAQGRKSQSIFKSAGDALGAQRDEDYELLDEGPREEAKRLRHEIAELSVEGTGIAAAQGLDTEEFRRRMSNVTTRRSKAEKALEPLTAEARKRAAAMRYVQTVRQKNAFTLLTAISGDLDDTTRAIVDRAVANGYQLADGDEDAFALPVARGGLPESQKELAASFLLYCKPVEGKGAWSAFFKRMGDNAGQVVGNTASGAGDLLSGIYHGFDKDSYRDRVSKRAWRNRINARNFADLGVLGNSFAEAGGIIGYWAPQFIGGAVGSGTRLAAAKAPGMIGRAAAKAVGVANFAQKWGPDAMYFADYRQQFLQRVALDGGDVTNPTLQVAATVGAAASAYVEHLQWGRAMGKIGLEEVQSQAYARLSHRILAKLGIKVGTEFGAMTAGRAAGLVLAERGLAAVTEGFEEAIQQAIEETVVQVGEGQNLRIADIADQSAEAFLSTIGPMMWTMAFGMPMRAGSAATMHNLDGDAIDRLMSASGRLRRLAAEGKLDKGADDLAALNELLFVTSRARNADDGVKALRRRGFSAADAATIWNTFSEIKQEAIKHGQMDALGENGLPTREELERTGWSVTDNANGTTTASRLLETADGRKRRQTINVRLDEGRPVDLNSEEEAVSTLNTIRSDLAKIAPRAVANPDGTTITRTAAEAVGAQYGFDLSLDNAAILADPAMRAGVAKYALDNDMRIAGNTRLKETRKAKDEAGNEIDEDVFDVPLGARATRQTIFHEVSHAVAASLRAMGLTDKEIDAIQNWKSGLDGKAPSETDLALPQIAGEYWDEERVGDELGDLITEPDARGRVAKAMNYIGDMVRRIMGIRKEQQTLRDAVSVMKEAVGRGFFGNIDDLNEAQRRVLLAARQKQAEDREKRKAETPPPGPAEGAVIAPTPPPPPEEGTAAETPETAGESRPAVQTAEEPKSVLDRAIDAFTTNRPLQADEMAALVEAGDVSEQEIYATGYRWHFTANAWVIDPEAVGMEFVPSDRYMGLDGTWHEAADFAGDDSFDFGANAEMPTGERLTDEQLRSLEEDDTPPDLTGRAATASRQTPGTDNENDTTKLLQQGTLSAEPPSAIAGSARRNFVVTEETLTQLKNRVKSGIFAVDNLIKKLANGGPINADTIVKRLAKGLHLPNSGARSRYGTFAREDGTVYSLRLSDHSATPESYNTHGSAGDFNLSLVVQEPGGDTDLRGSTPNVVIRQFTWDKADFTQEDARKFLESVKRLFETGEFHDLTGKGKVREQNTEERRFAISGLYTGSAADYAERVPVLDKDGKQTGWRIDNGPSLHKVGSGQGTSWHGWGLYATNDREAASEVALEMVRRRKPYGETQGANVYEQTFFSDRADGEETERRLLHHNDYEREEVSDEQVEWIRRQAKTEGLGIDVQKIYYEYSKSDGGGYYHKVKKSDIRLLQNEIKRAILEKDKNTDYVEREISRFLARAGIDGIKYKDSGTTNYVSFRDDNIRVDHKWTDGVQRYAVSSRRPSPDFAMDGTVVDALPAHLRADARRVIETRANTPAWMTEPDGSPTELSERDWLEREARAVHDTQPRFAISGIFSGGTGDYSNESRIGGVGDGPSLHYIGSGDGSAAFGWGLYGSTGRDVAESYADRAKQRKVGIYGNYQIFHNGKPLDEKTTRSAHELLSSLRYGIWPDEDALAVLFRVGNVKKAIAALRKLSKGEDVPEYGFRQNTNPMRAEGWDPISAKKALGWLKEHGEEYTAKEVKQFVYERTFFSNRATPDETERHLLKWYEAPSEEQIRWISSALEKQGAHLYTESKYDQYGYKRHFFVVSDKEKTARSDYREDYIAGGPQVARSNYSRLSPDESGALYKTLADFLGSQKAASEFLFKAGIDGVKYPIGSIHGKEKPGFNLVSFSDTNIRVDHKWEKDGATKEWRQRFQIAARLGAPHLGINTLDEAERLESDGVYPFEIWRMTGWWRGDDGEWRIEVGDIRLADDWKEKLAIGCQLSDLVSGPAIDAYHDVGTVFVQVNPNLGIVTAGRNLGNVIEVSTRTAGIRERLRSVLAHEIQHSIQYIEGLSGGANTDAEISRRTRQSDVDEFHNAWNEYEAAAEDLKKQIARYVQSVAQTWLVVFHEATIDENGRIKYPYLTFDGKPDKDSIPRFNGRMIRSLNDVGKAVLKVLKNESALNVMRLVRDGDPDVFMGVGADDLSWFLGDVKSGDYSDRVPEGWAEQVSRSFDEIVGPARQRIIDADQRVKETSKPIDDAFTEGTNAYYDAGGEVEARTVEARLGLTDEQRKEIPPWVTYQMVKERRGNEAPTYEEQKKRTEELYPASRASVSSRAPSPEFAADGTLENGPQRTARASVSGTAPSGVQKRAGVASRKMSETGLSHKEASDRLKELRGKPYRNKQTGITARLSSTGAGKLISNTAVGKSIQNGFTAKQHNELAASINTLFEEAILVEDRPDKNNDPNVRSIKRFVRPVNVGDVEAGAWITVKESSEHGHRIYSVEEIKMAALPPTVRRAIAGNNSAGNAATEQESTSNGGGSQAKSSAGRKAVAGRVRAFDNEPTYSPRASLAAIATMELLAGKEPDRDALEQMRQKLGSELDVETVVQEAKTLLNSQIGEIARRGAGRNPGAVALAVAENVQGLHPEDLVQEAFQRGAQAQRWAQGTRGAALNAIIRSTRGDNYADLVMETGIDATGVLQSFPEMVRRRRADQTPPASAAGGEAENQEAKPADAGEKPSLGEIGPIDPNSKEGRRIAEIQAAQEENIEKALRETDEEMEARRALEESETKAADESGKGKKEDEPDEEGDGGDADLDAGDESGVSDTIKIPVEVLERNLVDVSDPETFTLWLRKVVRNRILKANGMSTDFPDLAAAHAAEHELWANPTNVAAFAKSMSAILRDMARRMLDRRSGAYTEVLRKAATLPHYDNVDAIEDEVAFEVRVMSGASIRQTSAQLVSETRKKLKKDFIGAAKANEHPELQDDILRKITGRVREMAKWYRNVLALTEGGVEKMRATLEARLEERGRNLDEAGMTSAEDRENDAVWDWTNWKLSVLDRFGGTRYLLPAEARERCAEIQTWMAKEGMAWAQKIEAVSRQYEADRKTIIEGCRVTDKAGRTVKHEQDTKFEGFWRYAVNTIDQRLRLLFARAGGDAGRAAKALRDRTALRLSQGTTRYKREQQEMHRALVLTVRSVVGEKGVRAWIERMTQEIPEEQALALSKQNNRHLTYGQVMHLYGYLRQTATYGENIVKYEREGQRDYIERNVLTAEDIKILDGIMQIYADNRRALDAASRDLTGFPIKNPDPFYLPVKIKQKARSGLEATVSTVQAMPAVFSERRRHGLDVDEKADIMAMFYDRMEQTARVLGFGRTGLDIIHTFGASDVKEAMIEARGAKFTTALIAHFTDWMNGGRPRLVTKEGDDAGVLNNLRTAFVYTALWGNMLSAFKQTLSAPVFSLAREVGERGVLQDMMGVFSDGWKQAKAELTQSDAWKARYGDVGLMQETEEAVKGSAEGSVWQAILRAGMQPLQWGDATPGILCQVTHYKVERDRLIEEGVEPEEAKRRAADLAMQQVEWTQQSSRAENLPEYSRRGSSAMRMMMMFASSPMLQAGWEVQRIAEWREKRDAFGADSKEAKDAGAAVWNAVVVNHVVMPVLFQVATSVFNLALGKDPPDEKDALELAFAMLVGPFARLVFFGGMAKAVWNAAWSQGLYGRSDVVPSMLTSSEQNVKDILVNIPADLFRGDMDEALADIDKFLKRNVAPYRHARQAVENWSGD